MLKEKRQYTRVSIHLFVTVSFYQIETYRTGWLSNISTGGCFFPLDEELPVGKECSLTIIVGEGLEIETHTLSGRIVRSDSNGVGIQFDNDTTAQTHKLEQLIGRLISSSSQSDN